MSNQDKLIDIIPNAYRDEVVYIPNSAIDSNGDTTLRMFMEITPDKYYEATIKKNSVDFNNDLGKWRTYKREFFETKQERRDKKINLLLK
jgi:hypothetical protein